MNEQAAIEAVRRHAWRTGRHEALRDYADGDLLEIISEFDLATPVNPQVVAWVEALPTDS